MGHEHARHAAPTELPLQAIRITEGCLNSVTQTGVMHKRLVNGGGANSRVVNELGKCICRQRSRPPSSELRAALIAVLRR